MAGATNVTAAEMQAALEAMRAEMEQRDQDHQAALDMVRAELVQLDQRHHRTADAVLNHEGVVLGGFRAGMKAQDEVLTSTRNNLEKLGMLKATTKDAAVLATSGSTLLHFLSRVADAEEPDALHARESLPSLLPHSLISRTWSSRSVSSGTSNTLVHRAAAVKRM